MKGSRIRAWTICLAASVALAALPASAFGSTSAVEEFSLESRWIESLAQGPDGTVWYAAVNGPREHRQGRIGRIGARGPIGEMPIPEPFATDIAVGPEGDAWFLGSGATVGRLSPTGAYSAISIGQGASYPGGTAAAAGGGIWFATGRGASSTDTVGRIAAWGGVTEFPIPPVEGEPRPAGVVEGSEGDAWFTEYFGDRIGRVTPAGRLTEVVLPAGSRPAGIAVDAGGNIWFAEAGSGKIGRIDAAGSLTEFDLPAGTVPVQIAAAADGRLWFTQDAYGTDRNQKLGILGRLTPAGRYSEVRLPDRESHPVDIVAGMEGDVWYAAMGQGPCEGGGTCLVWEPRNPAIVGRVSPVPLTAAIAAKSARVRHGKAQVVLSCKGGNASDRCLGRLELKQHRQVVGSVHYSLAADQRKAARVRLPRHLGSTLGHRRKTRATAVAVASEGHGSRRSLVLAYGR
jgi:virginiamycin B lyase